MKQSREPDVFLLLATICDAMKRLEWAIERKEERGYYIEEATKRRKQVEAAIMNASAQPHTDKG